MIASTAQVVSEETFLICLFRKLSLAVRPRFRAKTTCCIAQNIKQRTFLFHRLPLALLCPRSLAKTVSFSEPTYRKSTFQFHSCYPYLLYGSTLSASDGLERGVSLHLTVNFSEFANDTFPHCHQFFLFSFTEEELSAIQEDISMVVEGWVQAPYNNENSLPLQKIVERHGCCKELCEQPSPEGAL